MAHPIPREMVRFGVTPIQTGVDFEHIRKVVLTCERLGYDSVWLNDHFFTSSYFYPLPPPSAPFYECWVTLSGLAGLTENIRLGTLCTNVSFRNPALLAKMAACLDVISGGRLELALGAGWFAEEHRAYGFPFPPISQRAEQLGEAVQIIKSLWTQEKTSFHGKHFELTEAYSSPKPLQRPFPIGIGARGSKLMLRVAARYADHWNIQTPITTKQYQRKVQILEGYCRELGRDPGRMRRSLWAGAIIGEDESDFARKVAELNPRHPSYIESRIAGTPEQCIDKIRQFISLGASLFILYFTGGRAEQPGALRPPGDPRFPLTSFDQIRPLRWLKCLIWRSYWGAWLKVFSQNAGSQSLWSSWEVFSLAVPPR